MSPNPPATIAASNKAFWNDHISELYTQPWIQQLQSQIHTFSTSHLSFFGLSTSTPQTLLDYACAHGTPSQALLPHVASLHATGVDIAPNMIRRYRESLTRLGIAESRFDAVEADFVDEAEPDDSRVARVRPEIGGFDCLVVSMALHHMRDYRLALRRLVRRVRRGGVVCVVEWDFAGESGEMTAEQGREFMRMGGEGQGQGQWQDGHGNGHGHSHGHGHGHSHDHGAINTDGHGHSHSHDRDHEARPENSAAATAGTIAHAGFAAAQLKAAFEEAGCGDFQYETYPELVDVPFAKPDDWMKGEWRLGFARAVRQ